MKSHYLSRGELMLKLTKDNEKKDKQTAPIWKIQRPTTVNVGGLYLFL